MSQLDYNKEVSRAHLGSSSSTGTYLAGAVQPQSRFISMEFHSPDELVLRVEMTHDQLAALLTTNTHVPVTLSRYRDAEGNWTKDVVKKPQTVDEKLSKGLNDTYSSLGGRISDVVKDLEDILDGKKSGGKKAIRELLHEMGVIDSNHKANYDFVVSECQDTVNSMKDDALRQLVHEFANGVGDVEIAKQLCSSFDKDKQLLLTDSPKPAEIDYVKKDRKSVPIDEMNAREVSNALRTILKDFERAKVEGIFWPGVIHNNGNKISIKYVNYQGSSTMSLEHAKIYLKWLADGNDFQQHYSVFREMGVK